MPFKTLFKILCLTYIITVKRNGIQDIDSINHKKKPNWVEPSLAVLLVGVAGFEPTTPCTPCKYATWLRYTPRFTNYLLFQFHTEFEQTTFLTFVRTRYLAALHPEIIYY